METIIFESVKYDCRHGGPFDRGSADNYYRRDFNPHYYVGNTGTSEMITDLNEEELKAYTAGYWYNEKSGDKKDWG